jgi:hypothetical protein
VISGRSSRARANLGRSAFRKKICKLEPVGCERLEQARTKFTTAGQSQRLRSRVRSNLQSLSSPKAKIDPDCWVKLCRVRIRCIGGKYSLQMVSN